MWKNKNEIETLTIITYWILKDFTRFSQYWLFGLLCFVGYFNAEYSIVTRIQQQWRHSNNDIEILIVGILIIAKLTESIQTFKMQYFVKENKT